LIITACISLFFYSHLFKPEKKLTLKEQAFLYLKQGNTKKAEDVISRLIKERPDDKELRLYLSAINADITENTCKESSDLSKNTNHEKKLEKKEIKKDNIALNKANAFIAEKKYKEAIPLLLKSIEEDDGSLEARQLIAKCYFKERDYSSAYKVMKELPEKYQNKYYMAKYFFTKKEYENALSYLTDIRSIDGLYLKARCYQRAEKFDDAIAEYQYIDKYSPTITIRKNLAFLFFKKAEYKNALPLFEYLTKKRPNVSDFHYRLAKCYEKTGNGENALTEYQKTLALKSSNYMAWEAMGNIYYLKKDWNKSIMSFKKALAHVPNSFSNLIKLGFAYNAIHNKLQATRYYKAALKCKNIGPDDKDKVVSLIKIACREI